MSDAAPQNGTFVGLDPWLPWPLSGWRWWTEPVPAQRLASLRIGLAAVLLVDLLFSYGPHLGDLFGPASLGSSELFSWYTQSPRWRWSIFRGFDHPLLSLVALGTWIVTTGLLCTSFWRAGGVSRRWLTPPARLMWIIWLASGLLFQAGLWSREIAAEDPSVLYWLLPLVQWVIASLFLFLVLVLKQMRRPEVIAWTAAGWALTAVFLAIGICLVPLARDGQAPLFRMLLQQPADASPAVLQIGFVIWLVSVIFLLFGFWTKTNAILAWVLSTSFANLNPNIDNAGDTVRGIILFYLMLCPCGAAWSIDSLLARRPGPVFVSPWALRLLFVQLCLIYFMNGLYKLAGAEWQQGTSLYYVLCDLTLARFSYARIDLPMWLIRAMSWSVLVWEVGFPLWVAIPWMRTAALLMGVAFHLGIMLTMELGLFGAYMLTLYLPLVPWERFGKEIKNKA